MRTVLVTELLLLSLPLYCRRRWSFLLISLIRWVAQLSLTVWHLSKPCSMISSSSFSSSSTVFSFHSFIDHYVCLCYIYVYVCVFPYLYSLPTLNTMNMNWIPSFYLSSWSTNSRTRVCSSFMQHTQQRPQHCKKEMGCSISIIGTKNKKTKSIPEIAVFVPTIRVPIQSDLQRALKGVVPRTLVERLHSLRNQIFLVAHHTGNFKLIPCS